MSGGQGNAAAMAMLRKSPNPLDQLLKSLVADPTMYLRQQQPIS
jgi:hypothetical protein